MKKFFRRVMICVVPLLVALAIVVNAFINYQSAGGGFKLGVDLVGGTILIYEVDVDKFPGGKLPNDWNPQELARRLKSRIDPGDLYNITIRVASNTRFEIILPTGGMHQVARQQEDWRKLIAAVTEEWPVETYTALPGRKIELLAEVYSQVEKSTTDATPDEKKKIEDNNKELRDKIWAVINDKKYNPPSGATPTEVKKKWDELIADLKKKWPPEKYEIGRGRTQELIAEIHKQHEDATLKEITTLLNKAMPGGASGKNGKRGQSMTEEQVQERKDLIAQVGSLEFMIIANSTNDNEAFKGAEEVFKAKGIDKTLDDLAVQGKPPPPPELNGDKVIPTPLGRFTYSWVELGTLYRHDHGLANPRDKKTGVNLDLPEAPTDPKDREAREKWKESVKKMIADSQFPDDSRNWIQAALDRAEGGVHLLVDSKGGTLGWIYSRVLKKTPLPEKEKEKRIEYFILMRNAESRAKRVTGDEVAHANAGQTSNVEFRMKPSGASLFYELTKANKDHMLAIVLDGYLESAAVIQSAISTNGQITMRDAPPDKIIATVKVLRSGALPATLKPDPVSESTMGPTLGADTIKWGAISVIASFGAVLLFMLIYYRFAGLVACVALLANLLLTLAFMVLIDATFTLPGLAGLVLMVGMAVDANILIYERLREERERGASISQALRNGYEHALPTIIDTHLSSIFTAIVLYVVGNDQLKGFGISLTVGLIISLFTSLYMTRVMFDFWLAKGWLTKLSMLRLFHRPNFNFMAIRYQVFAITMVITILGAVLFIARLDHGGLNIDFVGGVAYSGELNEPVSLEALRERLADSGLPDLSVEQIFISAPGYTKGGKSKLFTIRAAKPEDMKSDLYLKKVQDVITKTLGAPDKDWPGLKTINLRDDWVVVRAEEPKTEKPADKDKPAEKDKVEPKAKKEETGVKEVYLSFVDPTTGAPTFASRAQVSMLLVKELNLQAKDLERQAKDLDRQAKDLDGQKKELEDQKKKLEAKASERDRESKALLMAAQQFTLEGLGKENEGRFQWMGLHFNEPVKATAELEAVLKATQKTFRDNPQPERLENFDSQLATETQLRALYAIIASWGAILLYLWFRFGNWTFGAAAVICLIHDLFWTLGVIAGCHYISHGMPGFAGVLGIQDFKLDLPSVAALLTLVGYSVNDTIVVFDRIREVRGKNPALTTQMINDAVNQTLSRTILASLATWLVVLVLYIAGGEGVHLFSFVMVVGVIIGTLSSIYVASPLLLFFGEGRGAADRERAATQPVASQE
jgi:SecD/SecF fusion protein